MPAVLQAPREMVEAVAALRLPPRTDRRLQELMDRNNEGQLSGDELEDLESMLNSVRQSALCGRMLSVYWDVRQHERSGSDHPTGS